MNGAYSINFFLQIQNGYFEDPPGPWGKVEKSIKMCEI